MRILGEKTKTAIKDFLATCLKPIIASLISLGVALTQIQLTWRIILCIIPWILLFILEFWVFKPLREEQFKIIVKHKRKVTPSLFMNVRKLVEEYLMKDDRHRKKEEYIDSLKNICDNIWNYYVSEDGASYNKFSVSIKEVDLNEMIHEICRDSSDRSKGRRHEFVREPYPLKGNTPYERIIEDYKKGIVLPFVENNVLEKIQERKYNCTRLEKAGGIKSIPYKSVFVSPILPLVNPHRERIRGFICIDAEDTDMFHPQEDDSLDYIFHEYISGIICKIIEVQDKIKND